MATETVDLRQERALTSARIGEFVAQAKSTPVRFLVIHESQPDRRLRRALGALRAGGRPCLTQLAMLVPGECVMELDMRPAEQRQAGAPESECAQL